VKIALVTHNLNRGGGQGRVNYELVLHLLKAGVGVTLVAERLSPELLDAGAVWDRVRMSVRRPDLLYVRNFVRHADRAVERLRSSVDLVLANGFSLRVPHDVNVSHFVHAAWAKSPVHISRLRRGPYAWYHRAYAAANSRWERQSYHAARAVVAVSQKVRGELLSLGLPPERVSVIVNGVDPDEFRPGPQDRASLGLPAHAPVALFVGDLRTPRKNLDSVLHALASLPEVHLAVVGDASKSPFPALAQRLGVGNRAHFMGFRRDVPDIARAADVFVFPSRYEACSLAILEALASGLPVLTARTAGGSELVTPDCGHVLDDPDDVPALTHALRQLLQPGPDADRRRQHARAVGEAHSWHAMTQTYLRLFQSLLARPAPAAMVA
jgi:glycosyltransferase involved in cell wall biosynthesis